MHYHLEIILPPVTDVESTIAEIMAPLSESNDHEDSNGKGFYDYYVIGGRWAGRKLEAKIGDDNIKKFNEKLKEMKITVSSLQAGKQSLHPKEQIPVVDALWREFFPDSGIDVCPLFSHSNNQYNEHLIGDICRLSEVPHEFSASRLIIAGYNYKENISALHMRQEDFWNGFNHEKTNWDTLVNTAVSEYKKSLTNYKEEYQQKNTPKDNWLAVTVDYHS